MSSCPRPVELTHYEAILRNNAQFVQWLSPLNESDLAGLCAVSDYARQLYAGDAVLLAYQGDSAYRHKNIDWLSARLDSFLYIDRIIIGAAAQGQGAGRALYQDVMRYARSQGLGALACEVNTCPDNPTSHAFHRTLGFKPLADISYPGGKAVRYYMRKL